MEYYAPAKGAPSSFAGPEESSPASNIVSGGASGLPFYDEWQRHGLAAQRSPSGGVLDAAGGDSALEEAVWPIAMQGQEGMDGGQGSYPERPGEPDCVYYMRTGLCGFGMTCRFNHPPNRKQAAAVARGKGEYPERLGQPECQYYLKTGTCKFGATCKYHHPREKAGSTGRVHLNVLGLPLRQGEKECAYYMRTGSCKYGVTCKFHHPQPATVGALVSLPQYGSGGGGPSSGGAAQGYAAAVPSWPMTRSPYLPPRLQGPSSYGPVMPLPQGLMSMPGWSTYQQGPVGPPEGQQHGYVYGGGPQGEQMSSYAPYMQGSSAMGVPANPAQSSVGGQKDTLFPERPGQPECQYYMKTGDCKFGTTCRYHHPKDRATPSPTCHLSPIGLPLRPGAPPCSFYTRYGICKFGPTCKFDHPLVGLTYSPSASSLSDMPVAPYPIGPSSAATLAPSSSSDAPLEGSGSLEVGSYGDGLSGHPRMRDSTESTIGGSSGAGDGASGGGGGGGGAGGGGSSQGDGGGKS